MSGLKHVTETGVARLSAGCPNLTHLDMSGLINLSDGMQRDFALTGVQVSKLTKMPTMFSFFQKKARNANTFYFAKFARNAKSRRSPRQLVARNVSNLSFLGGNFFGAQC